MDVRVRGIEAEELAAWYGALQTAFFVWGNPDTEPVARDRAPLVDRSRFLAAEADGGFVGTFRSFASELTLPGPATVPAGGVSAVSVRPTHRRRGVLTAMLAADRRASVERGEVASILLASEWPIYGRFGFGPATESASWTLRVRAARWSVAPTEPGTVEILPAAQARDLVAAVTDATRRARPGHIRMPHYSVDISLGLLPWAPETPWVGHVAVHRDARGEPDAFARYRGEEKWDEGIPDNVLLLDELTAVTDDAALAMWRHLASMDLIAKIRAESRSPADPLPWWLEDGRAARVTSRLDHLWVRILDVERLLSARVYEREDDLVIEVVDDLPDGTGPAAGRYRLEAGSDGARCVRTTDAADVTVAARILGAASLGGTRIVDAGRAGGLAEHTPGAVGRLDRLFRTALAPWCPTFF